MQAGKSYVYIVIINLVVLFCEYSLLNGTEGTETTKKSSTLQIDPNFKPHLGTSYYLIELNGVDIGAGLISVKREGSLYKICYEVRTNKNIDYVFKARYKGECIMEADPLKPLRAELHQRVLSKTKEITISFEDNGRIISTETSTKEGEEPESKVRKTRVDGLVLDPLSAAFIMQDMDWELGKEKVLEVFTGKARYETRFTCVDEVSLEKSGVKRVAWVINQVSRKLDRKPDEQPEEKKNPWLRIYVASEGYPDVLKVETVRKIGHLTFTLDRFEPAPDQASH